MNDNWVKLGDVIKKILEAYKTDMTGKSKRSQEWITEAQGDSK